MKSREERFIQKILSEQFGVYFVHNFPYRYEVEVKLIQRAMKYYNWRMFMYGLMIGVIYCLIVIHYSI